MSVRMILRSCGLAALLVGTAELSAAEIDHQLSRHAGDAGPGAWPDTPAIVLNQPKDGGIYASPIGIDIGFRPANGAPIDLSTLKVTVVTHTLIGDLTFDITDDVSRYASPSGIHARSAEIPLGEHTVTISVADTERRQIERQLTITVRGDRAPTNATD